MADKRTRIDDLIRLGELRAAGSAPYSKRIRDAAAQFLEESGNNPGYFGESPAQTSNRAGRRAAKFRQQDILERDIKRGETTGLGDLLTFLPALSAGKAALAGNKLGAGVNALAFTSQFDDSKLGQAVGDLTAAYPMFGMRNIGGALKSAKRAAELGKQPPIFNMAEGRIAPNRMKLIEKGLREHIAMSGTKDVPGQLRKLDEWIERNPFWGKYPLHKRELFDTFPQDISGSLDQTLKDLGYGGITQAPRDLSLLVDKRVNRPGIPDRSSTLTRTWEEKKPFEQKALAGEPSGILKGWMERNPGKTPPIFTRPGEQTPAGWRNLLDLDTKARGAGQSIDPATKAFLEQMAIGSGIGTAANLATGGIPQEGGDNRAGLVVNSRNIGRLSQAYRENLERLNKLRPDTRKLNKLEAGYAAKYPKLYERALSSGNPVSVEKLSDPANPVRGWFDPFENQVGMVVPPNSSPMWKDSNTWMNSSADLAHELQHSVDLSRIPSGLRAPGMAKGTTINFGDFVSPGTGERPYDVMRSWSSLPSSRARKDLNEIMSRDPGPARYVRPQTAERMGNLDYYFDQPVEARAYKAGETAATTIERMFAKMQNPKTAGAGALGAAAVLGGITGDSDQPSTDSQAGLVVNSRNLGRLARLQEAAAARLDKIRPGFPEMNYLESVFAAKYPKIYEKSAGASPKGAFNPSLKGISSGSFSPFTSRVTVGMPDSSKGWAKPSTIPNIFNTMGHEALHGVDFQRLGAVNHPWTGRRLDLGDFIAPLATASPREMRDLIDNLKRFYPNADKMVRNIKPKYTLPSYGDEGFFTRLKKDIGYLLNPIEIRANRAGKTSSKTLSNLMDRLTSFEE